jgi:hypothetical protein
MRLEPRNLQVPVGVVTVNTDRGAQGRYKDCDRIRFFDGLPEKLGGWIRSSVGTTTGFATSKTTFRAFVDTGGYALGAGTINIASNGGQFLFSAIGAGDRVWLFGNDIAGSGVRVATGDADLNPTVVTLDGNVTATAGNACRIQYPEEFVLQALSAGAQILDGLTTGSTQITISRPVLHYLRAGTVVRIKLVVAGYHVSKLLNNLVSGATMLELEDPLPSAASPAADACKIFAKGSEHVGIDETASTTVSSVVRILANSPAASATLVFTQPILEDAVAYTIWLNPFQETFAALSYPAASAAITVAPVTLFGAVAGSLIWFPDMDSDAIKYLGSVRAVHDWVDLDDEKWAAIGTEVKLYLINEGVLFDITPLKATGVLVNPFDVVAFSNIVTVHHVGHGEQVGDYVRFSGGTPIGGLDLNHEYVVATVIDADTYTFLAQQAATSTVSGAGGSPNYEYDIDAGLATNSEVFGWGTGPYGSGLYGVGDAGTGVQAKTRIWSLDNFGEDLLAAPSGGALYWWDKTLGPTSRAVVVATAPPSIQRIKVSPQARHVVAFGAGLGSFSSPGTPDKLFIRWSDQADFSVWIPSALNLAGDIRLDFGSEIVLAVKSRQDIITSTDVSLHALQYVGGALVFGLRHLGTISPPCGPNAAVDVNGVVFIMTESTFFSYDGVLREINCPVKNTVYDVLDINQTNKVFASLNFNFHEVWWFYNDTSYVKVNFAEAECWDFGGVPRTAFHDNSPFMKKPYGFMNGLIFQHETLHDETTIDGTQVPMVSLLATGDMEIDEAGSAVFMVAAMIPDFKTLIGNVKLSVSGRAYPQSPFRTEGPYPITSSTERQGVRTKTRQLSFQIKSDQLGDHWRVGTWRAEVRAVSRRGG